MRYTYYHFSRCSKSREGLRVLDTVMDQIRVVDYHKEPPTRSELLEVVDRYAGSYFDLIRSMDCLKDGLDLVDYSKDEVVDLLVDHPRYLQRPLLCSLSETIIGRPVDNLRV